MSTKSWLMLTASAVIVGGIVFYITREIVIPPLPYKICLKTAAVGLAGQFFVGWLLIKKSRAKD